MLRLAPLVVLSFILSCVAASTFSGCSKIAERTLTIKQLQSGETYDGPFKIDTSGLPADAIESMNDSNRSGDTLKQIQLNRAYEFEIVIRLVESK